MARPFLSVIIPAYNEAKRLPITLIDVDRHLSNQDFEYEIIVSMSPSSDHGADIVKRLSGVMKKIKLLELPINLGKGAAVRAGMKVAKGSWRVYMDADNSTSIVEFNKMLPYLALPRAKRADSPEHGAYEVAIGSRYLIGASLNPAPPISRALGARLVNLYARLFCVTGVSDVLCGFKVFSETASEAIFGKSRANGWMFDVEVIVLARRFGYHIKEVPIFWTSAAASRHSVSHTLSSFGELLRITGWLFFDAYHLTKKRVKSSAHA